MYKCEMYLTQMLHEPDWFCIVSVMLHEFSHSRGHNFPNSNQHMRKPNVKSF